jgi:hypothetical protein
MIQGQTIFKRNVVLTVAACFLMPVSSLFAQQEFKDRIKAIQQEYRATTSVHIIMDVRVMETEDAKTPYYQEKAVVKKDGENYFYRISGMEMLITKAYIILVNEKSRTINCTKRDLKGEAELKDPFSSNLDSLLSFYGNPVLTSKENGVEHFTLTQSDGPILTMELYISEADNMIKRLDYRYEDGQLAVIEFKLFDRKPVFGKEEFRENKYFTEQKGLLKLSESYSRFGLSIN